MAPGPTTTPAKDSALGNHVYDTGGPSLSQTREMYSSLIEGWLSQFLEQTLFLVFRWLSYCSSLTAEKDHLSHVSVILSFLALDPREANPC